MFLPFVVVVMSLEFILNLVSSFLVAAVSLSVLFLTIQNKEEKAMGIKTK